MEKNNLKIGNRSIGEKSPVFIIADAGVNHNGRLSLAKRMVDAAKKSGVDAIKFQIFKAEELATPQAPKARYQKKKSAGESQMEMLKRLELSEPDFRSLFSYCRKKKIIFLATPFDFSSVDFLVRLGVPAFKISSGDLNNIPFLTRIAKYRKPVILSTGMSSLTEVKEAVKAIYSAGNKQLILLHCTSNYPTSPADVNLRAMNTLKKEFNTMVGYSDHTAGREISIAAVVLGARLIERHFTLDKIMAGPDHRASLDVDELKRMVMEIRNVEAALGDGGKKIRRSEIEVKNAVRKSLVAQVDIPAKKTIRPWMLTLKRPGTGIEPKYFDCLIGKRLKKSVSRNQTLKWSEVDL